MALFAFKLLVADEKIVQDELDFLELALLGELVGTAFFLWMHIYVKNKADPDDLALAKKLKLVWF